MQMSYCRMGLPEKHFSQLIEDLRRLIEENERFYVAIYDKDRKDLSLLFSQPRTEDEYYWRNGIS